ncbi:MAG: glycoside hydrolase family 15 protein [Bdellovibrionales bacterium]|nr:glycoside hydrolase family 15 protein [Bdellovibrionales bacterium]
MKGLVIWFVQLLVSVSFLSTSLADTFDDRLSHHLDFAKKSLLANISPEDALPGAVIASPSRSNPDYYYHWVRDASLVMQVILDLYAEETDYLLQQMYLQYLRDFTHVTRIQQLNSGFQGYGEPKYYVDGRAYEGPWGRPQNDGPALRASVLIRFFNILKQNGEMPDSELIQAIEQDLEFTQQNWANPSFDLWEEVKGDHFYTRMTQRKALLDGEKWAKDMQNNHLLQVCAEQIPAVEVSLEGFKDYSKRNIYVTLNRVGGLDYKHSQLDIANVLAILHSYNGDDYYSPSSFWVFNSAMDLEQSFRQLYPINEQYPHLGTAIGRYPEDKYYGGNPWFLTTLALAEYYYKLAVEMHDRTFVEKADKTLERVLFHAGPDGSMAEQMNLYTGFMESARDLTWSYASFITAMRARKLAKQHNF